MVPVSRAVGRKRAMQMLLTGDMIDARTAARLGTDQRRRSRRTNWTTRSTTWRRRSSRSSPLTVGIGKRAFYAQIDLDEHGAYEHTKHVMATNMTAADAQEGVGAFLDKREPRWTGR